MGFHDACSFWNIWPRSSASVLHARLGTLEAVIDTAEKSIREQGNLAPSQGGTPVGTDEIETLRKAHRTLLERFKGDLDVIRQR